MTNVEHLFMRLLVIYIYFFGKMSIQVFAHFLIGWFVLLSLSCKSLLYILNTRRLSDA